MLENKAKAMVSALHFNGCILSKTLKRSELATTSMQAPFYRKIVGKQLISDKNELAAKGKVVIWRNYL